jgi:hypothetical protein
MSQHNNHGYLFFKHGKFTGKITLDGKEIRLDGWWKESRSGRKNELISLAVKTEEQHQADLEKERMKRQADKFNPEPLPLDAVGEIKGDNPQLKDIPF